MKHEVVIKWVAEDIQQLRPDWTPEQCEDMLHKVGSHLKDRSIEIGWEILDMLLVVNEEDKHDVTIS
jgi:hypothetical protein